MHSQAGRSQDPTSVNVARVRDDVFSEMLLTLESDGALKLTEEVSATFRAIFDETVGDYLATGSRESNADLWLDVEFRRFVLHNTRRIGHALRERFREPTAAEFLAVANDVIQRAHDSYCESLPTSKGARGPVCEPYLHRLGTTST